MRGLVVAILLLAGVAHAGDVRIVGDTTGKPIGNTNDALKVTCVSGCSASAGDGGAINTKSTDTVITASALPTGAATSAKQDTAQTTLGSILTTLQNTLSVTFTNATIAVTGAFWPTTAASPSSARLSDGSAFYKATTPSDTQPVSAAALPLPSNAASETGGNLASIKAKTDNIPAQGQALAAGSTPVVLTVAQQAALTPYAFPTTVGAASSVRCVNTAGNAFEACGGAAAAGVTTTSVYIDSTTITNPTWVRNSGSTTAVTGLAGAALATESTVAGIKTGTDRIPAQGQALAAASLPVVLTAAQIVTLTPPAAITNFANETGGNLATIAGKDFATQTTLSSLNGKVTAVNTGAVVLAAGSALAGDVGIILRQGSLTTTSSSTVVTTLPALVAGSALAADVGIVLRQGALSTTSSSTVLGAGANLVGTTNQGSNTTGALSTTSSSTILAAGTALAADVGIILRQGSLTTTSTSAVVLPTLTKGTQGSTGVMTQDINDAGRVVFVATGSATGTTLEGMISMMPGRGLTNAVAATSMGVTSGKTLRLQSWCCTWRNNTAAAGGVTCTLRAMATGATTTASPAISVLNASTALATIGSGASACESFPDGIELSGTNTFGVSQRAVGAVEGSSVTVKGHEY